MNVLFSALLKESATREILLRAPHRFLFPASSVRKIHKYRELIIERTQYAESQLLALLLNLFRNITLVPEENCLRYWKRAKQIMEHIDKEDVEIIAAALSENAIIWSDDRHFQDQNSITIITTKAMVRL